MHACHLVILFICSNTTMSKVFAFEPNENSTSVQVELLLWEALKDLHVKITPFFNIDVSVKKGATISGRLHDQKRLPGTTRVQLRTRV